MCGVAGLLFQTPREDPADLGHDLWNMAGALHHRGPDDHGVWTDGLAGLAHTRLSVIDLSQAGKQPMASDDGQVVLTFNGEIYNFRELRSELEGFGFGFRGHSDTEVLLNGYRHWGEDVLHRLRGMFAFAIWDAAKRHMFVARDRLGKKPLYYWYGDGRFVFGSEIKALFNCPGVPREPDYLAIHHYLTYQYTPSPFTAFKGVRRLPPAHCLSITPGSTPRVRRYWQLPRPRLARPAPLQELKEELTHRLSEAVRMRMVADVPIGAFLSGGVDSSAVVAFMAEHSSAPVKTFTIGFEEKEFDETSYARTVAKRFGTDHHEMIVRPDSMDILPKIAWFYNEPYADISAIPTFYVSEMARKQVTVILNGDGGDEGLLGYGRYEYAATWPRVNGARRWTRDLASVVRAGRGTRLSNLFAYLRQYSTGASKTYVQRYSPSIAYFQDADKIDAYGEVLRPYLKHSSLDMLQPYFDDADDAVTGAAWADIHTYLPDDLLVKVDIASMAHSLEARSPLLDHEFFEWTAGIPSEQKIWGGSTKSLFKSAMEDRLPHDILYRPKMGFGVPVDRWLRDDIKPFASDLLRSPEFTSRGLFRPDYVNRIYQEHVAGSNHQTRLWALIMLEIWFRTWIDQAPTGPLTL